MRGWLSFLLFCWLTIEKQYICINNIPMRTSKRTIRSFVKMIFQNTFVLMVEFLLVSCAVAKQAAAEEPTSVFMRAAHASPTVTEEVNVSETLPYGVTIQGIEKAVMVSMEANPTTGYSWSYTLSADSVLHEVCSIYEADQRVHGMVGVGGRQCYTFSAVSAGEVTIRFVHARPWEKTNPIATCTILFTIANDGTITWNTPEVQQQEP